MDRELVRFIWVCAVFLALLFCACAGIAAYQCSSKWERSGFSSDWGLIQGCMIEVQRGKWIPEERYRELDE